MMFNRMKNLAGPAKATGIGVLAAFLCCGPTLAERGASLRQLRFAQDGRHVLAQDSSGATVLTVCPLAVAFRIALDGAALVEFTPDGQQVVLVRSIPRVDAQRIELVKSGGHFERWSIADRARVDSRELPGGACRTKAMSPDGRVYVCVDPVGTLRLTDISTAEVLLEKKKFGERSLISNELSTEPVFVGDPGFALVRFSPDGRFLIALPDGGAVGSTIAWDLRERRRVRLAGALKGLCYPNVFTFLGPDRVLISPPQWRTGTSTIVTGNVVSFPAGRSQSKPKLPPPIALYPAADSRFVIVRPFLRLGIPPGLSTLIRSFTFEESYTQNPGPIDFGALGDQLLPRAAAYEIGTGRVIISDTFALDALGDQYVAESAKGEVGLYKIGGGLQTSARLGGH